MKERKPEYDPSYFKISYPNGDVPGSIGVCTDLIIRAYRSIGIDFQKEVYMFKLERGLPVDRNIDHRRCRDLIKSLDNSRLFEKTYEDEWQAGDLVFWILDSGRDHVGIVSDKKGRNYPYVIHHLYTYPSEDDVLKRWKIIRHYRLRKK